MKKIRTASTLRQKIWRSARRLLVGCAVALTASAFASGWGPIGHIEWKGVPLVDHAATLQGWPKRLEGTFRLDSAQGAWLNLSVVSIDHRKSIDVDALEVADDGRLISKRTPPTCELVDGGQSCHTAIYFGPGKRTIRLRYASYHNDPVRVVDVSSLIWVVDDSTPLSQEDKFVEVVRWMKSIYWKSRETEWPTVVAGGRMALKAPPGINPIPTAVRRMVALLPENKHSFVMRDEPLSNQEVEPSQDELPNCLRPRQGVIVLRFPAGATPVTRKDQTSYVGAAHHCLGTVVESDSVWVDLRQQSGGSAHVLLASLGPVFGDGPLVTFINGQDKAFALSLHGSTLMSNSVAISEWPKAPRLPQSPLSRVRFLIGPNCASACETTAIAAIGRFPRVGQPTSGFTTANESLSLGGGYTLALTAGVTGTKDGVVVYPKVGPDQIASDIQVDAMIVGEYLR